MSFSVQHKPTVLITGCSPGGIGEALAREYHSRGFHVYATARRPEVLVGLESLGMTTLKLDVTSSEGIKAARQYIEEDVEHGARLDVLVNNAGYSYIAPGFEQDMSQVRAMFDINLFSVMEMCQEFTQLLMASRGQILNIGSLTADAPNPFRSAYSASKSALHTYDDVLRLEMRPFGVDVVTVVTGSIATNMNEPANPDAPPPFEKGSIFAPITEFLLAKRKERIESGQITRPDDYARKVVSSTWGRRRRPAAKIYKGKFASLMHYLPRVLPWRLVELVFERMNGLHLLSVKNKIV